jgi:rRNA-processing protein FCF1
MQEMIPINQPDYVDGELIHIASEGAAVFVHMREGETLHRCTTSDPMARKLAAHLHGSPIRAFGDASWIRRDTGWELQRFLIEEFLPLTGKPAIKTVAVDASFLAILMDKQATLFKDLDSETTKVIIPTPALAEVLTHGPQLSQADLEQIQRSARFQIRPFDDKAAFELAQLLGQNVGKNMLKFDRQIVAIAKVYGASVLYANDEEVVRFAVECGLPVIYKEASRQS